jgi:hypothetical protein
MPGALRADEEHTVLHLQHVEGVLYSPGAELERAADLSFMGVGTNEGIGLSTPVALPGERP